MCSVSREYGKAAEQKAAEWLLQQGYLIRDRNWSPRSGHVELDIVAQQGTTLVFVEVKARNSDFLDPLEAINRRKIARLVRAAHAYVMSAKDLESKELDTRFDIIAIEGPEMNLEHIPGAFLPPLTIY